MLSTCAHIWQNGVCVCVCIYVSTYSLSCTIRNAADMHFVEIALRKLEVCVQSARKVTKHLKRHQWAASTCVHMEVDGMTSYNSQHYNIVVLCVLVLYYNFVLCVNIRYDNKGCGRSYLSQRDLDAHILYRHSKDKPLAQQPSGTIPQTSVRNPISSFPLPPFFPAGVIRPVSTVDIAYM